MKKASQKRVWWIIALLILAVIILGVIIFSKNNVLFNPSVTRCRCECATPSGDTILDVVYIEYNGNYQCSLLNGAYCGLSIADGEENVRAKGTYKNCRPG